MDFSNIGYREPWVMPDIKPEDSWFVFTFAGGWSGESYQREEIFLIQAVIWCQQSLGVEGVNWKTFPFNDIIATLPITFKRPYKIGFKTVTQAMQFKLMWESFV